MAKTELPFDYYIFKKPSRALTYKMSDSLRSEYDAFGEYIFANTNSNNVRNEIVTLKTNYQLVYSKLERELIDSGNKKSKHCYEELSLVFQFMYQLLSIDSTLSQQTLGEIFSFKPTDFAKLGIYPLRAYSYYQNMFQDKGLFGKSKISGVVNSKVQLPLLCRSQVVVSNDSDLFVNLVQGDNKMFFVTRPADISADTIGDLMYSLARFSFCNVNNGVKSQKFKDKVVDVLDIKDTVIAEQFLIGILQSDVDLSECVRDGNAYEFNEMRKEYRQSLIDRSRSIEAINEGDYSWFEDYDDEPEVVLDKAENDISRYEYALVSNLAGDKYITKSKSIEEYKVYLGVLSKFLCRIDLDISDEDTILSLAACYFIVEYYKANPDTTIECLKDFIAGRKISDYFDSICKESKNPHLAQIADEGCLLDELENCKDVCHRKDSYKDKKSTEPFLIYIDTDAYHISQDEINELLRVYQVALVIRGKSFEGLKVLDKELQLYSNVEELHNEYKK